MFPREVAITGVGVVSCLGTGAEKVAAALRDGRSGVRLDPERQSMGFRGALTGAIDDFQPPRLTRRQSRSMTEYCVWAYAAAREALAMAGWDEETIRNEKSGVIVGNDSSGLANILQVDIVRERRDTFSIGPGMVFQSMTSNVTMNLNAILGFRGACWTVSGACASGAHAVGQAADLISLGRQDRVLCGGVQEINWQSMVGFDATEAFSTRHDAPTAASRPFDADRDGLVPSGGAAMIALEDYRGAMARGAQILGKIRAYAFNSDGDKLTVPAADSLARCARGCLEQARISAERIDYVCAHATSTLAGDAVEAGAIRSAFPHDPWVSSTKAMTGHEMWMSGAAQVVYVALMGLKGFIAPNINFVRQEPDAPRIRIATETIDRKPRLAMLNSAGFGGTNACLLLELV